MSIILGILIASWNIFRESAIYVIFGFAVAGILYIFVQPEVIARYLGKGKARPVFLAALFGIPIPLCSCGVLPAAAGLKKQGANRGATLSFLISTPESGVDSIAITYALLDPIMTVLRPVAAFITAVTAGLLENFFGRGQNSSQTDAPELNCKIDNCCDGIGCPPEIHSSHHTFARKIAAGMRYSFVELLGDIGKWFIAGILLAGIISYFVPDRLVETYLGAGLIPMLVMLIAGVPMYICATASTPIAAALVLKGLSPGAALVFLLAGPATNIASLTVISGILGKRSVAIYLGAIAICSLVLGFGVDMVYGIAGVSAKAAAGKATEIFPEFLEIGAALFLAAAMAYGIWNELREHRESHSSECAAKDA